MKSLFKINQYVPKPQRELYIPINEGVFVEKICKSEISIIYTVVENKYKNTNRLPQSNCTNYKIKGINEGYKVICEITSLDGEILGRGVSPIDEYRHDIYKGWLLAQHRANIDWRVKAVDSIKQY